MIDKETLLNLKNSFTNIIFDISQGSHHNSGSFGKVYVDMVNKNNDIYSEKTDNNPNYTEICKIDAENCVARKIIKSDKLSINEINILKILNNKETLTHILSDETYSNFQKYHIENGFNRICKIYNINTESIEINETETKNAESPSNPYSNIKFKRTPSMTINIPPAKTITIQMKYYPATLYDILSDAIKLDNKLSCSFCLKVCRQLFEIIACLNCVNLHHNDIKIENIAIEVVENKFNIVLLDFGGARYVVYNQNYLIHDKNIIETDSINSTITTVDPLLHVSKIYDDKNDIWSVGIVFIQLLYQYNPIQLIFKYMKIQNIFHEKIKELYENLNITHENLTGHTDSINQLKDMINKNINDLIYDPEQILKTLNSDLVKQIKIDIQEITFLYINIVHDEQKRTQFFSLLNVILDNCINHDKKILIKKFILSILDLKIENRPNVFECIQTINDILA